MTYYTYRLETDMAARLRLDEDAEREGYEDARILTEPFDVTAHANELVDYELGGNEFVADDHEEYRARFIAAYVKAFLAERKEMEQEQEEPSI